MFTINSSRVTLALVAAALVFAVPSVSQAQRRNHGQALDAVVQLHRAQLALAKRLASDEAFAKQFDDATDAGNYDAIAALTSSASGLSKSSIQVSGRSSVVGSADAESAPNLRSVFRQASFETKRPAADGMVKSAVICFNLGVVSGCISW